MASWFKSCAVTGTADFVMFYSYVRIWATDYSPTTYPAAGLTGFIVLYNASFIGDGFCFSNV
jgi:hypothetical protein